MASYEDTVNSFNPVAFYRLDELSGSVMTDSSGNAEHGTYYGTGTFGVASPIETDAASKAISGAVGTVSALTVPDISNAFTWIAWGYHSSISGRVLICRNKDSGFSSANVMQFIGHRTANVNLADASSSWGLSYDIAADDAPDAWVMVAVTRNTNVMRLYSHGLLVAERTDLPVGSLAPYIDDDDLWSFGRGVQSAAFTSMGTDEIALFDYALTAANLLEIYESALAVLPLRATVTVRVSVELDTDQVIPVDFPFAHNFANPVSGAETPITEILSYKTNVNQSEPDYQQRINAQPHHAQRTLEYMITPASANARARLHSALWIPGEVYKLPVWGDWMPLTAQATATDSSLSLDTTKRDYQVGSYVVICSNVRDPSTYQFFLITSVADGSLGITPNVVTTVPVGSPAAPARLACLPESSLSVESHLADRETGIFQFEVLSTELSTRRVTAYTPSATYKSIEVFNLEKAKVEWLDPTSYQITRRQLGTGNPTGNDYQRAIDTGSPQTIPLRVLLTTRAALSEFYGWLDARQGKQNPVWVISNEDDFEVTARTASSLTVTNTNYKVRYDVHHGRRDIAILKTDGTYAYHRISAAVDNGNGTETLTVNATTPLLAVISKVSFLKFCTAPDIFELTFHRDISIAGGMTVECSFVMTELLTSPA